MPNHDKIVEFLRLIRPTGPWTLYAMEPDSPVKETKTFGPNEAGLVEQFVTKYYDKANLYFVVNPTTVPVTKNPEKELISEVQYLHVDVDPDSTKDHKEERKRIKESLLGRQNPPTVLIDSGGGMQALWKLDTPIKVILTDEATNIAEIEAYNRQLEREYAADHCHNINRLLRLPYTVNYPTEIKRKRGRVKANTDLIMFDELRTYPLTTFLRADIVSSNAPVGSCDIIDFGAVHPIDIDSISNISGDIKTVILTGNTPDGRYKGRSEAMFAATRHMVKMGCSDVQIASILLDRAYKISAHIYDQRNPQEYVKRQIARAKTKENEKCGSELLEMNDRYCVAQDGNKTWIFSEEYDHELDRPYIKRQDLQNFQQYWAHRFIELETDKGTKAVPLAKWWFQHPRSRRFEQVIFLPNKDVPNTFNLWRGFSVEAKQGDWSLYRKHLEKAVCSNNPEYLEYLLNWMAYAVQHPEEQGHVAVVLRGPRGSGKGSAVKFFGELFGRHFVQVADNYHVTGNFNAHLRECVVLFADEAFFAGDHRSEQKMKGLITEPTLSIEAKHVDVRSSRNCVHLIMSSNQEWVVPAGDYERRFFVLDVDDPATTQNTAYFAAIIKQMTEQGGKEAFLYDLMTRDLSNFNIRTMPKTAALYEQQLLSAGPEYQWWYDRLKEGQILPTHLSWDDPVSARQMIEDYQDKASLMGHRYKKISLDQFFKKVLPTKNPPARLRKQVPFYDGLEHKTISEVFYMFPSLKDCRSSFCKSIGVESLSWPDHPELVKRNDDTEELPF